MTTHIFLPMCRNTIRIAGSTVGALLLLVVGIQATVAQTLETSSSKTTARLIVDKELSDPTDPPPVSLKTDSEPASRSNPKPANEARIVFGSSAQSTSKSTSPALPPVERVTASASTEIPISDRLPTANTPELVKKLTESNRRVRSSQNLAAQNLAAQNHAAPHLPESPQPPFIIRRTAKTINLNDRASTFPGVEEIVGSGIDRTIPAVRFPTPAGPPSSVTAPSPNERFTQLAFAGPVPLAPAKISRDANADLPHVTDAPRIQRQAFLAPDYLAPSENTESVVPKRLVPRSSPQKDVDPRDVDSRDADPPRASNDESPWASTPGYIRNPFVTRRQQHLSAGEYLHDGGDRRQKVRVKENWEVVNLDTQDTVAHFDTLGGDRVVVPSNRVDIYAPRFAAVGKVQKLIAAESSENPVLARRETSTLQKNSLAEANSAHRNLAPGRSKVARPASGLNDAQRGTFVDNTTQFGSQRGQTIAQANRQTTTAELLRDADKAFLATAIDAAHTWTGDVEVQSVVEDLTVVQVTDVDQLHEVHESHHPNASSRLRILKLASTDAGHPGDFVDFTIRFDNTGNQPIGNVTIMDNLTTRLAYVDGTAKCDVKGDFIAEPNVEGSTRLRWEISEPLLPGRGGTISFRCRIQ